MSARSGLRRKIWAAFIVQVAAISFATVLGVYCASAVLKDVLIQRALTDEAGHYWKRLASDPSAALPDTYNMQGFLRRAGASDAAIPDIYRGLDPGYHSLPKMHGGALVYVEDQAAGRLYLVFNQQQVDALAFFFGAVPLAFVLIVIYAIAWITYRISKRAVSPVIWLSNVVQRWDPKQPDATELDPASLPDDIEGESRVLAEALHGFATRIAQLVERERNFTRDASHELRTPLTVIRMACDLLQADGDLPPHAEKSLRRIKGSARDMESLIESFLILAREGDTGLPEEDFVVNELVREELERVRPLLVDKPVELKIDEPHAFALHGPSRALSVILTNLLRNACVYTDRGAITVTVGADSVSVADTGQGMTKEELARVFEPFFRGGDRRRDGHGIGLSIVQRLSERFGWPVTLESEAGVGTRATVRFPSPQPVDG